MIFDVGVCKNSSVIQEGDIAVEDFRLQLHSLDVTFQGAFASAEKKQRVGTCRLGKLFKNAFAMFYMNSNYTFFFMVNN